MRIQTRKRKHKDTCMDRQEYRSTSKCVLGHAMGRVLSLEEPRPSWIRRVAPPAARTPAETPGEASSGRFAQNHVLYAPSIPGGHRLLQPAPMRHARISCSSAGGGREQESRLAGPTSLPVRVAQTTHRHQVGEERVGYAVVGVHRNRAARGALTRATAA